MFIGMINIIKKIFKLTLRRIERTHWKFKGSTIPTPHSVKQVLILKYRKKHKLNTFVETGTFLGEMVGAMNLYFDKLYSIELSEKLANQAVELFKNRPKITIICGDSTVALPVLLDKISEPCLFWLDGHFSSGNTAKGEKDTPIMEELLAIGNWENKNSVIVIDDARLFDGTNDYPSISTLSQWVKENLSNRTFIVENDMIVIEPLGI